MNLLPCHTKYHHSTDSRTPLAPDQKQNSDTDDTHTMPQQSYGIGTKCFKWIVRNPVKAAIGTLGLLAAASGCIGISVASAAVVATTVGTTSTLSNRSITTVPTNKTITQMTMPPSTSTNSCAPRICPRVWAPVCGSDGKTYENECFFGAAYYCSNRTLTKVSEGKCKQ